MKHFFKYVLATVVGILLYFVIALFIFFGIVGAIASAGDKEVNIKPNSILSLKLNKIIVDRAAENPFGNIEINNSFISPNQIGLNDILKSIEKAKDDDNIKGIFMDLTHIPAGFATVEEIRNALLDFEKSGKFIYTYSEYMTQISYYLASASTKIYMNPVGTMELKGLRSKISFFKGALEKAGVEPVIFRHGKFKSAIEPFLLDKMSEANKEQTLTYVTSIWNHLAKNIAEKRGLSVQELNQAVDNFAIRRTQDAVDLKIIDGLRYRDELIDEFTELTGAKSPEKLNFVKLSKYNKVNVEKKSKKRDKRSKIAIVYASGEIKMGKSDTKTLGEKTISEAIRKARRDSTVKAVVLRVNSPGGSGLASDIIWREALLTQKEKPLIVSMGDLAASGGYYISCPADAIVASPTTLTGSIGVFGLMFNTQELMTKKLGVTFDGVKTHKFADLPDLTRKMTEAEKEIIQSGVEDFYDIFISKVGDGRGMTKEAVDKIGQGRVWSGANAKEIGLVDEFGGLNYAIKLASEKAGLETYKTVEYPELDNPFDEMVKQLTGDVSMKIVEKYLGNNTYFYNKLKSLQETQGIQARMPYDVEIY